MAENWKKILITAVKAALGAAGSIVLAGVLGLSSPMTAGVLAVLSIQSTKRATWRVAGERLLAFVCATLIAGACLTLLGYTLPGFAVYLFLYAVLCVCMNWGHALAPISVLVTHYVLAGSMPLSLIANEALLLVIGAGTGMLINLGLRPRVKAMERLAAEMDAAMIAALHAAADAGRDDAPFRRLEQTLSRAEALAAENRANRLFAPDDEAQQYVSLRRSQYAVLEQLRRMMQEIPCRPPQYAQVCALLHQVADEYHRDNDVTGLLASRQALLDDMKTQPLPVTREEFESRAMLYNVLLRLEDFLILKHTYYQKRKEGRR